LDQENIRFTTKYKGYSNACKTSL